jgi:hypothetical protein
MKVEDIKLPVEIKAKDLKYPKWDSDDKMADQFDMWYTERFGWCIPTLFISRARRGSGMNDRTYGTTLQGEPVTMGKGPHVLRTVTVYVRNSRKPALQTFLDLKLNGQAKAGDIRDRISTRRAQTVLRRQAYGGGAWNL